VLECVTVYSSVICEFLRILVDMIGGGYTTIAVVLASTICIVDLIAKGYGYSTYAFLALINSPVATRRLWLVLRREALAAEDQE